MPVTTMHTTQMTPDVAVRRRLLRVRRGASLALVAISMTAITGVGALAIDLGMLYKARADALYAAEAGALAGASAFLDYADPFSLAARTEAAERAIEYARRNRILTSPVGATEVAPPEVIPAEMKVRVRVGRVNVGTWFSAIFGESSVPVSAVAAAAVREGDDIECVSPFMIPDSWAEDDTDPNANRWEDSNEEWTYDPNAGDRYNPTQNGFGSNYRNGRTDESGLRYTSDFGRRMTLKRALGNTGSGNGTGGNGNGGNGNGGNGNGNSNGNGNGGGNAQRGLNSWDFWSPDTNGNPPLVEAIEECRDESVGIGDEQQLVPGVRNGVMNDVRDALRDRINADNTTRWDNSTQSIISNLPDWKSSPKVIKVGIYNPELISTFNGSADVEFNNVGLFLLENVDNDVNITGRFLYYVTGTGSGNESESGGSLVKHLVLVE